MADKDARRTSTSTTSTTHSHTRSAKARSGSASSAPVVELPIRSNPTPPARITPAGSDEPNTPETTESAAVPASAPSPKPARKVRELGLFRRVAESILLTDHFALSDSDDLFYYSRGVYRPNGERHIQKLILERLRSMNALDEWSTSLEREAVEFIRRERPQLWKAPLAGIVNVLNGLLDLRTRTLLPHTPHHLSIVQLPVNYLPAGLADSTPWIDFLDTLGFTRSDGGLAFMEEILGYLIASDRPVQQSIWLTGEGSNGKSTFLNAVDAFLGTENVARIELGDLEKDKFAAVDLYGKLANIVGDTPPVELESSAMFKKVIGGDKIRAQHKWGHAFVFHPFCKLLFSGNSTPRSKDASYAYFRRWVIVPFVKDFEAADPDTRAQEQDAIIAKLSTPSALSGALLLAVDGWNRLKANRKFTLPTTVKTQTDAYRRNNDPIEQFIREKYFEGEVTEQGVNEGSAPWVFKDELRDSYNVYAAEKGLPLQTPESIGKWVVRYRPEWKTSQRRLNGVRATGWWGARELTLTEQLDRARRNDVIENDLDEDEGIDGVSSCGDDSSS